MSQIGYDENDPQGRLIDGKINIDRMIDRIPFLKKYHQQVGMILLILFGLIILSLIVQPMILLFQQNKINSYPTTEAVVNEYTVKYGFDTSTRYISSKSDIECSYEVDGQTYHAKVYGYDKDVDFGTVIQIHYDPIRPSDYYYGPFQYQIWAAWSAATGVPFVLGALMIFIARYMKYGHIQTKDEYMDNNYRYEQTRQHGILPPHEKHTEPLFEYYQSPDEDTDNFSEND